MAELITERIRRNTTKLRLHAIAGDPDELIDCAKHDQLGYREFLDLVLEAEVGVLEGRRYQSRLKMAGLAHHKTRDDFDVAFQPDLDPKRLAELRSLRFIQRRVLALILGPPGVGPTSPSASRCKRSEPATWSATPHWMISSVGCGTPTRSAASRASSRSCSARSCSSSMKLATCDSTPPTPTASFKSSTARYTRGSTIVTSNKTVSEWAQTFGDQALAAAILDRLLHDAEVLAINGTQV
jgi:DNA replication protein DnaC